MPVLELDDGRALAYEEWGDPSGAPVVLFHGAPGSRLLCPDPDATARLGVRLITFDRPGFGASDRMEGRALLDTPRDVAQIVDALELDAVSFLGVSGGGPHALACAVALRDRVHAVGVASMPGPLDDVPGAWEALGDIMRPTAEMARREPARALRAVVRYVRPWVDDPETYIAPGGPEPDRHAKARFHDVLVAEVREALRPGAAGLADDLVAFWRPWGFRLDEVRPGARHWHGAADRRGAPDAAYLGVTLPACRPVVWPDEGHLGILPRWAEVLEGLLAD